MTDDGKNHARNLFRAALFIATAVSLYFVPWPLLLAWLTPLPDSVHAEVDAALDHGFDGIIVYVDRAGRPPTFHAAGWHDRDAQIPSYPEALFKIASIGKLYDAVAVTRLVADGRLALDDTLAEMLPSMDGRIENAGSITLRMLVQHRSGIPNLTDTPGFWSDPPTDVEDAWSRVLDQPADFAPDERYAYSNTNYMLLGRIIERTVGYSAQRYIREQVVQPLGLTHTFGSLAEVDLDALMSGYYVGIDNDIKTTDYASMIASAEDVGIFLRALNDGSLLSPEEQAIYASLYVFDHTGLIPGYQSIARYHPDIDAVVVLFVNTTDFEGYTWSLGEIVYGRVVRILRRSGALHVSQETNRNQP